MKAKSLWRLPFVVLLFAIASCSDTVDDDVNGTDTGDPIEDVAADTDAGAIETTQPGDEDAVDETDTLDATDISDLDTEPVDGSAGQLRESLRPDACLEATAALQSWPVAKLPAPEFPGQLHYAPLGVVLAQAGLTAELRSTSSLVEWQQARRARWETLALCGEDDACAIGALSWTDEDITGLAQALQLELGEAGIQEISDAALALGYPWGSSLPEGDVALELVRLSASLQNAAVSQAAAYLSNAEMVSVLSDFDSDRASAGFDADTAELAAALLIAANSDEAFRYDPLVDGLNRAAYDALAASDRNDWPFVAILVPGQGPTSPDEPISPLSIQRADLAAARWQAGLAPVLLLSGGHVHPDRTPYAEALEMRNYLISQYGIPESAIVVDPYARHTTTNLRNAARILWSLPVDHNRPILVTSDVFQSAYIAFGIVERSQRSLGYVPWQTLVYLGDNDSCAILTPESLRLDPTDVLDP
ncbi:MAG: YdcF family protein [Myxococcales bacterium]|nr:YdcF family protein [Myxococcales bacterium]